MYCPKCNAQITGTESACPVCGVPFIQPTTPPVSGAQMINPDSVAEAVQTVSFVAPEKKTQLPSSNKKERKKLPPIVIIILVLLAGLGILYLLAFTNFGSTKEDKKTTPSTIEETGTRSYGGYKFDVPDGYIVNTSRDGLVFKGSELYFIIGVDYSNNYEKYKENFSTKYNTPEEKAEKTYNKKRYLLYNTRENNTGGSIYVTDGTNGITFIGVIIRKDDQFATEDDIATVFNIISKATSKKKNFTPNEEDDLGKYGLKIYQITPVFKNE